MATTIRPEQTHDRNGIINLDDVVAQTETQREAAHNSDQRIDLLKMRVSTIKNAKADAVARTDALRAVAIDATDNTPAQVVLEAAASGQTFRMQLGEVAHDQIAYRLKIDKRYYDRMRESAPQLLATNIQYWMTNEPEERLLRMLKPEAFDVGERRELHAIGAHFRLRGLLGKGYRTIDDADLIDAILPALVEQGAKLVDFSIDERRMHAKFTTDVFTMDQIRELYAKRYGLTPAQMRQHRTIDGKDIAFVNEPMSYGVEIRHSEVGFASLGAMMLTRIAKCTNDLVGENAVNIRHVGGKNGKADDNGDARMVSDTTQLLDNAALLSRVHDAIREQFDPKNALNRANEIVLAKVSDLPRPKTQPLFEFIDNVGINIGLTQNETDLLKQETVKSIAEEGGEKKFAFIQGITAVARQMTDYDRRLDTERTGFALLQDDAGALLKLGRDAEKRAQRGKN